MPRPQPNGTLVKALARAWRWQRLLDDGIYASVSEIGDAENISKSYISRILRLALLAPDIIETVLAGSADQLLVLEQLERPLPPSWEQQRGLFCQRAVQRLRWQHLRAPIVPEPGPLVAPLFITALSAAAPADRPPCSHPVLYAQGLVG